MFSSSPFPKGLIPPVVRPDVVGALKHARSNIRQCRLYNDVLKTDIVLDSGDICHAAYRISAGNPAIGSMLFRSQCLADKQRVGNNWYDESACNDCEMESTRHQRDQRGGL